MEGLSDVASFATKLKNTLIQYHSIEEDKWRVAKKTKDVTVWRKPSEEFNGYLVLKGYVIKRATKPKVL
ncbi:STARD4 isoform 11 [Pan troglodytes]|uniref:StAR related lipid transfer domain containing 4 n=2 Tax=Homininae TaxID=207598 RepID=D6REN7_HUMAN|nr:StAR related lipid transfer domain containing 4 [Homo sapiens]KAI4022202.1 StAR related lipid transfer domain containing 4 [Homo sapiens]PNI34955.1 STARD4 isoform 11 [Pan troglodytes]